VGKLLTVDEVAERLGLARQTLWNWRALGKGPPVRKLGGRLRYDESQLERWVRQQAPPPSPTRATPR
jgi:excisionase family DNA binding protein